MPVLLWMSEGDRVGTDLRRVVERVAAPNELEIHHHIDTLAGRLRQPGPGELILVFSAATQNDLSAVLSIRDLLQNTRLILILPDDQRETVARGHLLGPRFLTYADGDVEDVGSVLARMLK